MDEQEVAEACSQVMWSQDLASQHLGMQLMEIAPGRASMSMRVTETMVNGWDLCHGGLIATLADSAFAFACNTYGNVTVASGFDVTFIESAALGDLLVAEARERSRWGSSGLYDVTVTREGDDATIAEFRGRSRSLKQPILDPELR